MSCYGKWALSMDKPQANASPSPTRRTLDYRAFVHLGANSATRGKWPDPATSAIPARLKLRLRFTLERSRIRVVKFVVPIHHAMNSGASGPAGSDLPEG